MIPLPQPCSVHSASSVCQSAYHSPISYILVYVFTMCLAPIKQSSWEQELCLFTVSSALHTDEVLKMCVELVVPGTQYRPKRRQMLSVLWSSPFIIRCALAPPYQVHLQLYNKLWASSFPPKFRPTSVFWCQHHYLNLHFSSSPWPCLTLISETSCPHDVSFLSFLCLATE